MNQAYLFNTGNNFQSYKMLGSRPDLSHDGEPGYRFAVWAPNAKEISVVGDFNFWNTERDFLHPYGTTGIWTGFIGGAEQWQRYKYAIRTKDERVILKADPFARHAETRPDTASILYNPDDYEWHDQEWMANRTDAAEIGPLNIYECHLGSWRRYQDGNTYTYREIAPQLAAYLKEMGYNAVELMPVNEYPHDGSWGYQVTGYFAITSRYGTPADFKYFVDVMHQAGIKVIVDWVPAHFPRDEFALANFDGQPLYEYPDPRMKEHPSWGTLIFNYGLNEVNSFLISSAWLLVDEFHVDGLRVDAVSSIISLNFGHEDEEKIYNSDGGEENLEGITFVKKLNQTIRANMPEVMLIAEESTAWPHVTEPVEKGGLGFTHKWNMGWMNDILQYVEVDYYARGTVHNKVTFSMFYAFSERYVLPFSHDEVVHGKKSLLGKMPGDYWRQFASLRSLFLYQYTHPGAKLNFMGNEFAPYTEWRYYEELEWFMLKYPTHKAMQDFKRELNHLYLRRTALWEDDRSWEGFQWVKSDDKKNSVFAYIRRNLEKSEELLIVLNFTPKSFTSYSFSLPASGTWRLLFDSDAKRFGGSSYLESDVDYHLLTTRPVVVAESTKNDSLDRQASPQVLPSGSRDEKTTEHKSLSEDASQKLMWELEMKLPPLAGLIYLREIEEEV
ncbi:MAG TPA: 1,4-alpha-glucan branching protein GlgB [Clostridiaceae bacterium]|nr:1,4-alpha-glucan branching protein GlgB [Clostridiaceae bacterium]